MRRVREEKEEEGKERELVLVDRDERCCKNEKDAELSAGRMTAKAARMK